MASRFVLMTVMTVLAGCPGPSDEVVAQCVDQCLAAAGCPSGSDGCLDLCEDERSFSNHIGCSTQYEAMLNCLDTATDVCDQFGSCPEEVTVYFTCYGDYCFDHLDDEQCDSVGEGGGAS